MCKSLKTILTILSITGSLFLSSSCQRTASCPAYHSVDPSKAALNMSKEKFMNPDIKKDPEDNKKEVEKRKNAELKAKTRRGKKPYNLFPSYMR
jgi:hypothetical protein